MTRTAPSKAPLVFCVQIKIRSTASAQLSAYANYVFKAVTVRNFLGNIYGCIGRFGIRIG